MPRVTVTVGPLRHFNLSLSYGVGGRSIDPGLVSQDLNTPFLSLRAYEGGFTYALRRGPVELSARAVGFLTKVDRDLVFSETLGRNKLADGTTRLGGAVALRALGSFFDEAVNLTLVRPTFDDTHLPIPYVPRLVLRQDLALFRDLGGPGTNHPVRVSLGVGWTLVGHRALPYGQRSDIISVVDASAAVATHGWQLSLAATNLFDQRYRLSEFNYRSDFHSAPEPTLVPARHFSAGAPRGLFVSLSKNLGGLP
jgi:outer membrane receptor protein involved in Fe transport